MKILLIGALILFILATSAAPAQQQTNAPQFADYPAKLIYTGKSAPVVLASEQDRMFRTRLRRAAQEPANFAGEYVLTTWGCGTECLYGAVVSLRTGQVAFLPGSICCWQGEGERLYFRHNSRLLVVAGLMNEADEHGAHFYEFTGTAFKHLKTISVKPIEPKH